ncbi:helix-turn-helix domain-containing protein [Domibacillus iocasae]|uniref:Transcriptional regulator n=1 Tax=Domibacillus iocasae TaxID=1714016 RepID=A0A1E7DRY2_9BACI|nr:helix-turn-helix transcriptional regulator [Domibacillus iocasae]OES45842.1 transcriptional regulator [Domibacillus iocasae]
MSKEVEKINNLKLGKRVREIRISKGIKISHVAKKLGYKSSSMISEFERGKKGLDAEKIPLLAEILGVSIEELFFNYKNRDSRCEKEVS